ncbi:hypothetical protein B2J88_28435 [Rhodococcus sp. SRB_17]|nr:hypothetical protein [Rhodococcus sp. SRB_17]
MASLLVKIVLPDYLGEGNTRNHRQREHGTRKKPTKKHELEGHLDDEAGPSIRQASTAVLRAMLRARITESAMVV